jgi:hypothetical protein
VVVKRRSEALSLPLKITSSLQSPRISALITGVAFVPFIEEPPYSDASRSLTGLWLT